MIAPIVETHRGVTVVRDDLFPGGTKARYIVDIFADGVEEVVYASPAQGGAQSALAVVAEQLGKRATIFVPLRKEPHERAMMAKKHGATVYQVKAGYLNVLQSKARQYVQHHGAGYVQAPFGIATETAIERIAEAARATQQDPTEVWCAAGSGTLARGLMAAWPSAQFRLVQVGKALDHSWPENVKIIPYHLDFDQRRECFDFPSDPHYDAKAWDALQQLTDSNKRDRTLFWNVTGPAE